MRSTHVADPLPSWRDGPAKQAIAAFVERVTKEVSPERVELAERIAVFDNDGTLWCEQPSYVQGLFLLDRIRALAPRHQPVGIQKAIGRRPIPAFGNSDGDLQMLQWTTSGAGPRFGLIVHHTDAEREAAYDRHSRVGKLDRALDEAAERGWTVVDMQGEWKTIFPAAAAQPPR